MTTVTFKGVKYEAVPVSSERKSRVLSALLQGVMTHLGSLNVQLAPQCSTFQVYETDGSTLLAGACSANSQWIDVAFWLHRFRSVPVQ